MRAIALAVVDPAVRFEQLVRAYQRDVWRYLRFLGANAAEADDLVQETFLEVWRKPFTEYSEKATASYLRLVAKNRFLMGVRSRGRKPKLTDLEQADSTWARLANDDAGEERVTALKTCLETLKEQARRALELVYKDRLERPEIADALGLQAEGLKTLLRRAKVRLKECVEQRLRLGGEA